MSAVLVDASGLEAQQVTLAAQAQTNAAVFRDQIGRHLTFICSAQVNINQDIYGTDVYTDTSPICAAAAHAGVFTRGTSTAVTIRMGGEAPSFTASTRNSVTSLAYGRWSGTYAFVRDGSPGRIDWGTTIVSVATDYLTPITLECPPAGADRGEIWGNDVYPEDSAICVAGVHAGAITMAGGTLTLTRVPKQASFPATTRYAITSRMWSDPAWRSYPQPYSVAAATVNAVLVQPPVTTGTATPAPAPVTGVTTVAPTTATGMTTPITGVSAPTSPAPLSTTERPISSAPNTSAALDQNVLVGVGMSDITGPVAEVVLMGYADGDQKAAGLHTRLYARAFIFASPRTNKRVVWVSAELGQLFSSVKQGVLQKLAAQYGSLYNDQNVMISATHTHSGPGGYSHHTIYNISIGGFFKQNYDAIVDGITEAIGQAHRRLAPGNVSIVSEDLFEPTMVNRSKVAFTLNREYLDTPRPEPVNRNMALLKILSGGRPIGVIAFHAVHNTSMPKTNRLVSSDHKGYAAYLFEKQFGSVAPFQKYGDFVAAFPNGAEGDLSPNIDTSLVTEFKGPSQDPFESTQIIGTREFSAALGLFNAAASERLSDEVDYRHKVVLMPGTQVRSSNFTNGAGTKTLCVGAYGLSFAAGAEDGRASNDSSGGIIKEGFAYLNQSQKDAFDILRLVAIGIVTATMPALAPVLSSTGFEMQKASTDQCQYPKPILLPTGFMQWSPEILPFQLFRIGQLAIAGVPGEMTVQAGRRLEAAIMTAMAPLGIKRVLITGLANEYSGYITTPEEFPSQQYEGASTLFGRLTLDAYKEVFQELGFAIAGGTDVVSRATAPDLSGAQLIEWASKVDHDERPALEQFGQVLLQPSPEVARGGVVHVIFRSAHPNNAPKRNDTYFRIERELDGGNVELVAWDGTPDTKMHWALSLTPIVGPTGPISDACPGDPCLWSTTGIVWTVPADVPPGRYRIRLFGSWKHGSTRELIPFQGATESFTVR
jgi:neutral ceramidase